MPPYRTASKSSQKTRSPIAKRPSMKHLTRSLLPIITTSDTAQDMSNCDDIWYPLRPSERTAYRTPGGKGVTEHCWAVYDFVRNIPLGKVTTYKIICSAIGQGSPRSVGSALRNNPFAPFVPCHRIIASNGFIGGFVGEWGTDFTEGTQTHRKLKLLANEGVGFSKDGYIIAGALKIWKG